MTSIIKSNNAVEVATGITNVTARKIGNVVILTLNGVTGLSTALPTELRPLETARGVGINSNDTVMSRIIVNTTGTINIAKSGATVYGEVIYAT